MWRKASPVLTVATSSRANIQGWSLIGASNREHPSTCWFARLPLPEIERKRQEPTHAQTWCRKLQSTRTDKYSLSSRPEGINTENERRLQYPHSRGNHVRQRSISNKKTKITRKHPTQEGRLGLPGYGWLGPTRRGNACSTHHRLVVVPVPAATVSVRDSRARRPRGRLVHVPCTPAPHRAESMAAANPASPPAAATAARASTAALVREHAHLGGGAAAAPWGGVAVAGARVGRARVAPAGAVAVAGILRAPGPLNADGGAADDVRRCVGNHGIERRGLRKKGAEGGRER